LTVLADDLASTGSSVLSNSSRSYLQAFLIPTGLVSANLAQTASLATTSFQLIVKYSFRTK